MQEYVWYFIRTTGLVSYFLMYAAVMLGLYSQLQKQKKKPIGNTLHLHEALSNWTIITAIAHLILLFFDQYVSFHWQELLIPFMTAYKPLPMALGIFSLYLLLITWLTTKLRKQMGMKLWKTVHMLTPILYVLVTIHGVLLGTDFQKIVLVLGVLPTKRRYYTLRKFSEDETLIFLR